MEKLQRAHPGLCDDDVGRSVQLLFFWLGNIKKGTTLWIGSLHIGYDEVCNDCQLSDHEFDDEVAFIGSQTNVMDHNASNDIINSKLNSKDNDDNDNDDDD